MIEYNFLTIFNIRSFPAHDQLNRAYVLPQWLRGSLIAARTARPRELSWTFASSRVRAARAPIEAVGLGNQG